MIRCHNGRKISSIVVTSIMGHSGRGDIFPLSLLPSYQETAELIRDREITVAAKSGTRFDRPGNYRPYAPWRTIQQIKRGGRVVGLINSFGLRNPGVEACAIKIKRAINQGYKVIPNYFIEFTRGFETALKETEEAVKIYEDVLKKDFHALIQNASCPNSGESIAENQDKTIMVTKKIRDNFDGFLIVKLSPDHPLSLAVELVRAGADAVEGLNSFPHASLFPNKPSPLGKYGGAYSGEMVFEPAMKINTNLRATLDIPMLLGCGISSHEHATEYWEMIKRQDRSTNPLANNSLVICSIIRNDPRVAQSLIRRHS